MYLLWITNWLNQRLASFPKHNLHFNCVTSLNAWPTPYLAINHPSHTPLPLPPSPVTYYQLHSMYQKQSTANFAQWFHSDKCSCRVLRLLILFLSVSHGEQLLLWGKEIHMLNKKMTSQKQDSFLKGMTHCFIAKALGSANKIKQL